MTPENSDPDITTDTQYSTDIKALALAFMTTPQLRKVLENPGVTEANKNIVRTEIARREAM